MTSTKATTMLTGLLLVQAACSGNSNGIDAARGGDADTAGDPDAGPGDDGGSTDAGSAIAGSMRGQSFGPILSSYWIGKPDVGGAPVQVYLSDASLSCAAISAVEWDKTIGDRNLLEIGLARDELKSYRIGTDADANYLRVSFNPSANAGTVTLSAVEPTSRIRGSFRLSFGTDQLEGTFDAAYCAIGVEP